MNHAQFWGGAGAAPYEIEQSLRFNSADSAYLNRTPGSAGNRRTWTLSFWFKRGKLGTYQQIFSASDNYGSPSSANYFYISISGADDKMYVQQIYPTYNAALDFSPNGRVFRDPSAWYHVVLALDTTQATGSNRQKMWINGELQTLVNGTSGGPTTISQNYDTTVNTTNEHRIGRYTSVYWDGYLAEVNFIDGSALTHEDFGELDDNGVWRPIAYTGSYGTNGYYLNFSNSSDLGEDQAGSNDWTGSTRFTTSGTGTDVMSDTPTNNHCTFNPLDSQTNTPSNGNLSMSMPGRCAGTMAVTSGKWYWECKYNAGNGYALGLGIADIDAYYPSEGFSFGVIYYGGDGSKYVVGTNSSYSSAYSGGHFGIALDLDSAQNTIEFFLNGTSKGTINIPNGRNWTPIVQGGSGSTSGSWDMYIDENTWTYTAPTGFKPLNTSNLSAPTVKDGSKNFNTVLWTGNGTSQAISTVGFQPDLVWEKTRNDSSNHWLTDAIRGTNKILSSSLPDSETTNNNSIQSFDPNGFTVGSDGAFNGSGITCVAWNWLAGGTGSSIAAGSIDGTNPTIASTVSANPSAGFSIVSYTGTGNAATVGHGLGVAPSLIIEKNRDLNQNWAVYHSALGATKALILDDVFGEQTATYYWNDTAPTSNVFSIGTWNGVNSNTQKHIAYCFAEVEGYSKFGRYTGNGSTDGTFVYCGFKPAWIMVKSSSNAYGWAIHDTTRQTYNEDERILQPNTGGAEATNSLWGVDILSNGFKWRNDGEVFNYSGYSYIFAAFASSPFGGSGVSPATAR
jgi:hypothetical protein